MGYQLTKLEAVNLALTASGATKVTAVDSVRPDAQAVVTLLDQTITDMQQRGWWFNREFAITLAPDAQGRIIVPQNTLSVDPMDTSLSYVLRGDYLYDRSNATYTIGTSVTVDIISRLDWEELPYAMQSAIQYRTAMRYVGGDDGDADEYARMETEFSSALGDLLREDLRASDVTVRSNPMVSRVMHRRRNRVTTRFGGAAR